MDYYNNKKRNAAPERIAEEMDIGITFLQVKDIMKSLRTFYLKERSKVEESTGTDDATNELDESKWKFFNELYF